MRPRPLVPTSLDEALQLGRAVVAAKLAPRGMETAEACMIAILHGLEVGLSPMQALQRIAVVDGRPTIWGDGALALVQASGLADSITESVDGERPEEWVASCTVLRRGERQSVTRTFSVKDAQRARLWGKAGPWSEYPLRMLQMRARAFALRDVFADVLGGLYLREELPDAEDQHGRIPPGFPTTSGVSSPRMQAPGSSVGIPADSAEVAKAESLGNEGTAARTNDVSGIHIAASPARQRRKAPVPPWMIVAGPVDEGAASDMVSQDGNPHQDGGAALSDMGATVPMATLPPARPRSMSLRLRRPSAAAARRRFSDHWEVRRPRALGEGKPRSIRPRRSPDVATQPDAPDANVVPAPHGEPVQEPPRTLAAFDTLQMLDDALCCASDQATLDEIVEEFSDRFAALGGEDGRKAEVILRRHVARIASLAVTAHAAGGLDD